MARFLLISVLLLASISAWAQTSLQGKVTNKKGESVPFATVSLIQNGSPKTGAVTDYDGIYIITGLDPGTYDLQVSEVSEGKTLIQGIVISANHQNNVDVKFTETKGTDLEVVIIKYIPPVIDQEKTGGKILTGKEISVLPIKSVDAIVAQTAGVSQSDEGKGIAIRGSREDANLTYVDGIPVRGAPPAAQDIDQLEVITGGIPASIGDVTGGAISITTKGGSRKFKGNLEAETSQYLDAFGYSQLQGGLSGPIIKNKSGDPIVSFRVSGAYTARKESNPSYFGAYKLKDDVLADLKAHPTELINGQVRPRAQNITADQVERVQARPNAGDARLDINGKLDFRLNNAMDITLSGGYSRTDGRINSFQRNLMSYDRNAERVRNTMRGSVRFRHRIGEAADPNDKKGMRNVIENAQYTLQGGFSFDTDDYNDPFHKDNLFAYGQVARFDFKERPNIETTVVRDTVTGQPLDLTSNMIGYTTTLVGYDKTNSSNPGLAAYNDVLPAFGEGGIPSIDAFRTRNGFVQEGDRLIYAQHLGVNQVYNLFHKGQNSLAQGKAELTFDLLPTRKAENKHSIQLGFLYEQREDRQYTITPRTLWQNAQQLANRWFDGLDKSNILRDSIVNYGTNPFGATSDTVHIYANKVTQPQQYYFAHEIRKKLGLHNYDYVNVDELSAKDLNLGMFSPDELMVDQTLDLNYYGYDYKGNPVAGGRNNFNSFWTDSTAYQGNDGVNFKIPTRAIGAFQPIYMAGYIQDKFSFDKILFRVGLRVDRFDANTKVMRDIYSLYKTYNAKEFYATVLNKTKPSSIGDDYIPYIDASNNITAFRSGDKWYSPAGAPITDATTAFYGRGKAVPATISGVDKNPDFRITGGKFSPDASFEDYTPQLNFMPRLAFSFPISDKASFFAHYDILTSRPLDGGVSANYASPLDYYRMEVNQQSVTIGNPKLKSARAIDYEVGFQQQLSNTSALKAQVYYKEMRDQIQEQLVSNAYPNEYITYRNSDFGTVKGMTFTFEQRRVSNLQFSLAYTLQFADGTGSSATSSRGINLGASLRNIYALSYDERHRFALNLDYRFEGGKKYDGPMIGNFKVFENTGINVLATLASGRPFTQKQQPTPFDATNTIGSINGSRLPWNNVINLRIDRDIQLTKSEKNPLMLNVYFRVQNLLNTQNWLQVYQYTGTPYDDGYLTSDKGASIVASQPNPASYELLYRYRMANPDYVSLPRRMYVGAIINF